MPNIEPQINQVWEDLDPRMKGRTFRIERIYSYSGYVVVKILTDRETAVLSQVGREVRIHRDRLRPIKNGYRLVSE